MTHHNLKIWLEEYAENALPPEVAQDLGQHLAICPECQEQLKTIRLTRNIARASRLEDVPVPTSGFVRSILQAVERQKEVYFFWRPLNFAAVRALPVMAGLALVLGSLAYFQVSSTLSAEQLPDEPLLESSLELSSKWGQESAVFSERISEDQEQVVSTLMESESHSPNSGKESEK
jgi:anti-sigma factor RsiW